MGRAATGQQQPACDPPQSGHDHAHDRPLHASKCPGAAWHHTYAPCHGILCKVVQACATLQCRLQHGSNGQACAGRLCTSCPCSALVPAYCCRSVACRVASPQTLQTTTSCVGQQNVSWICWLKALVYLIGPAEQCRQHAMHGLRGMSFSSAVRECCDCNSCARCSQHPRDLAPGSLATCRL